MLKNITALEIEIDQKVYKFLCDIDSPIGSVHDALMKMKGFVVDKINESHMQNQPAESPVPTVEKQPEPS